MNREEMKDIVSLGEWDVVFTKRDGSVRTMRCTLDRNIIPESAFPDEEFSGKKKKFNPDVLSVWDLEKDDWRSFRLDSIISVRQHMENLSENEK